MASAHYNRKSGDKSSVPELCRYFKQGYCRDGNNCRFLHVSDGRPSTSQTSGRPPSAQRPPRPQSAKRPDRSGNSGRPDRPCSAQRPARQQQSAACGAYPDFSQKPPPAPRPSSRSRSRPPPSNNNKNTSLNTLAAPAASKFPGPSGGSGFLDRLSNQLLLQKQGPGGPPFAQTTTTSRVVQVVQEEQRVLRKPALVVHAYFLIDASGSMAGERMKATLEYVAHMIQEVLGADDLVTIWTFSSELLHQLNYRTKARSIKLDTLQAKVMPSGTTRLYDNCVRALESMRRDFGSNEQSNGDNYRDVHGNAIMRQLVVFTDGCDNKSGEGALETMAQELRAPGLPNFHFTCLAVGQEGAQQGGVLERALQGCKHAKVIITAKASREDIGQAFGKAQNCLREAKMELIRRIVTTQEVVEVRQAHRGRQR